MRNENQENMPFNDNILNKNNKRVHWDDSVKDITRVSKSGDRLFKKPKHSAPLNYDKLWNKMVNYIRESSWEGLDFFLKVSNIEEVTLKDFYIKKGSEILYYAMLESGVNYRHFFLHKIPKECAQEILKADNFSSLSKQLMCQKPLQEKNLYTKKTKEDRIEGLLCLLKVDRVGVCNFIDSNLQADYMNDSVLSEYQEALARLDTSSSSTENSKFEI